MAGLLSAVLVHQLLFKAVSGEFLSFSTAYQNITFGQEIREFNPIEKTTENTGDRVAVSVSQNEKFRIIAPVENEPMNNQIRKSVVSPTETFKGSVLFPNSEVYLEIHSNKLSVLTHSDDAGNWSWSNFGKPLEDGKHTIDAYNISPYELSGKRDIFIQRFAFDVDSKVRTDSKEVVLDASDGYNVTDGEGHLGDKFIKGETDNLYFFDFIIQNKKEYSPGEEIGTQLIFSELGSRERQEAEVKYELFIYDDGIISEIPTATIIERLDTKKFDSFFKKITLKNKLQGGSYIIVVTVTGGGEEYVQSAELKVRDEIVVMVGNNVVTKTKLLSVLVWNVLFLMLMIIMLLLVSIYEYKRMMIIRPIDEDSLKKQGYF